MPDPTRRDFLRATVPAAGAASLASCTPRARPHSLARSYQPPGNDPIANIDTRWPIKRVVYLMMENRSFDHLFGRFPGTNGRTVGVSEGREIPLRRSPQWTAGDLPHDWDSMQVDMNGGKMDGFGVDGRIAAYFAYTQNTEADIPNYWHWARNYVLADNLFASAGGNSYPQHLFMVAGTSGGTWTSPFGSKPSYRNGVRYKTWGCDGPKNMYHLVRDKDGRLHHHSACWDLPTVGDQLLARGVDWRLYSPRWDQVGYIWNPY